MLPTVQKVRPRTRNPHFSLPVAGRARSERLGGVVRALVNWLRARPLPHRPCTCKSRDTRASLCGPSSRRGSPQRLRATRGNIWIPAASSYVAFAIVARSTFEPSELRLLEEGGNTTQFHEKLACQVSKSSCCAGFQFELIELLLNDLVGVCTRNRCTLAMSCDSLAQVPFFASSP